MRRLLLIFLLLWASMSAQAQNRVVKGKVFDEHGDPLPGVTVTVKAADLHSATNGDGMFSINVPTQSSNILVFTFIGYETSEVDVKTALTPIEVRMKIHAKEMDEVVVALNLQQKKRSLGFDQTTVNVGEMTEARAANITDLLDGKVPGLQLTTSGYATGSTRVVINGPASITGDNQPLWVVDGVPIYNLDGQTTNGGNNNGNVDYGNGASALNPDDIQSIEVLSGPNAAALYGSAAANGAILVTTKKGKAGAGVGVSVNENYMASRILQFPDFQNVYGEGGNSQSSGVKNNQGIIEEGTNSGSYGGPLLGQPIQAFNGSITTYSPHPDNVSSLYNTAYALTQNFAISNATSKPGENGKPNLNSSLRLSYTRVDANDVIDKQDLQTKNNLAFNMSKDFTNFLTVDTRIQYLQQRVQNRPQRNEDPNNILNVYNHLARDVSTADLQPWADANGNELSNGTQGLENPYWLINENYNQDITNTIIGGLSVTAKILPGLSFRAQISTNLIWGSRDYFLQKGAINSIGKNGFYSEFGQNNQNWQEDGLFVYNKQFKNISLNANFGGSLRKLDNYNQTSTITSLLTHSVMSLANNASVPQAVEAYANSQVNSLYGTATIGYKDYLFLELTGRNDWSSTLPAANRSYFYPSASGSFIFTDVIHIPENILSFGKLRASIAQVGNATSPYNLNSAFNYVNAFNGLPLLTFDATLKNPNLKPEKTVSIELGTELRFFKDRLSLDASVYHKNTTNQILTGNISNASFFNNEVINAGSVSNKGIDLALSGTPVQTKNFRWNINVNYGLNRNKVNSLIPGLTTFKIGGVLLTNVNAEVGQPIGVLRAEDWLKDAQGNVIINPANGLPYSGSTPGTVDGKIPKVIGNYEPKSLESFGSTFTYKQFDFNFLLNAHWGGQLFSGTQYRADVAGVTNQTLPGRDAYEQSAIVYGEGGLPVTNGITTEYGLSYPDAGRAKGPVFQGYYPEVDSKGNIIYDSHGLPIADKSRPNIYYLNSNIYFVRYNHISSLLTFDDSFIKLSQVIIGYNIPRHYLNHTVFKSARISLVGRNLWTILQNTPKGIDPESAYSSGNAQGLELGGALPYCSYGIDLKFTL